MHDIPVNLNVFDGMLPFCIINFSQKSGWLRKSYGEYRLTGVFSLPALGFMRNDWAND